MKKTLTTLSAVAILTAFSPFAYEANAETSTNMESKISQTQKALADLNEQIKKVDQAISDNRGMIVQTEKEISDARKQLEDVQKQVNEIEKRMESRKGILENRARSLQEDGSDIKYLDVLLGSQNFNDFVDRASAVTTIVEADQNLMSEQKKDAEEVTKKQKEIEKKLNELENKKTELLGMKEQIQEQQEKNDRLKESLKEKEQSQLAQKLAEEEKEKQEARQKLVVEASKKIEKEEIVSSKVEKTEKKEKTSSVSNATSKTTSESKPSGSISTVISAGYKYIGNSVYVFGGGRTAYDVANGRFDCSGFVHWAFAQGGISVGSSTSSLSGQGTKVSFSDIQPGDIVFFNTYKHDGHVGIYIGNGEFIGSQSSTGVAVANMTSGYWKEHFSGHVRRIM